MAGDGRLQAAGGAAAPAARAEPWGVFSLTHGAAPRDDALALPYVRGACVRAYWRDFEPQEGRFDWTLFDETLARAQRHGKQAAFRVMNGTGTPEWVYAAGAQAYDPQDRGVTRLPLPWDDVFFEKWRAFIGALARRYDGHPGVAYVAMSMPAGRWAELLFPVSLPHAPRLLPGAPRRLAPARRGRLRRSLPPDPPDARRHRARVRRLAAARRRRPDRAPRRPLRAGQPAGRDPGQRLERAHRHGPQHHRRPHLRRLLRQAHPAGAAADRRRLRGRCAGRRTRAWGTSSWPTPSCSATGPSSPRSTRATSPASACSPPSSSWGPCSPAAPGSMLRGASTPTGSSGWPTPPT